MYAKSQYKYCIVPQCTNTSITERNKLFISVPKDAMIRKKWCRAMKRDDVLPKTTFYVCEDHFDLEHDISNYMRYRLMKGKVFLRKEVVPHKFECQKNPSISCTVEKRRRRKKIVAGPRKKKIVAESQEKSSAIVDVDQPSIHASQDIIPLAVDEFSQDMSDQDQNFLAAGREEKMAPVARRLKLNEILTLLDVLEQFPIVWNIKIKDYSNKSKREEQTKLLLEELSRRNVNMGEDEFRVRFKSIKDTYRKELRKVDDSMKTKRGDPLYVPRLAWYDRADAFLREVVCGRLCPSNMQEEQQQIIAVCSLAGTDHEFYEHQGNQWVTVMTTGSEDAESDVKPYKESNALMIQELHSPGPSCESRSPGMSTENNSIGYVDLDNTTIIKCEPLDSPETEVIPHNFDWDDPNNCGSSSPPVTPIASIPPTLCRIVQTTTQAELCHQDIPAPNSEPPFKKPKTEDRFDVFGKNVAYKLREMDKVQRILAEKIINDALFEGEMGVLTRHHKLVDESQAVFHPEVPSQSSVHCISPNSSRSASPSIVSTLPLVNTSTADE